MVGVSGSPDLRDEFSGLARAEAGWLREWFRTQSTLKEVLQPMQRPSDGRL